jgi:hypothetical protein
LVIGIVIGYFLHRLQSERLLRNQQDKADNILRVANEQARLIDSQARESATKIVSAAETELKERRIELSKNRTAWTSAAELDVAEARTAIRPQQAPERGRQVNEMENAFR